MNSFYNAEELKQIGFKQVGVNVLLSRNASIYGAENISLGNHIRIDDFCILSGRITIGNYVHIAAYSALYGSKAGITIDDYANISSRVCVFAVCDDFSGDTMTNPMISDNYKNVYHAPTHLGRHVIIGTGSTILHGVDIGEGTAVGAMSLVTASIEPWGIYAGIPCRRIKERSKHLLVYEQELINQRVLEFI